jgi:ABC-type uncharacterized transport system substrate-binding protein
MGFKPSPVCKFIILPLLVISLLLISVATYKYIQGEVKIVDAMHKQYPPAIPFLQKKVIAYVEDGDSVTTSRALRHTLTQLVKLGWFDPIDIPCTCSFETSMDLWNWAADNLTSDYIALSKKHAYSFGWNEGQVIDFRTNFLQPINNRLADIDLIIGMGNLSGRLLAQSSISRPIAIFNARNPGEAGYSEEGLFSSKPNVFVAVNKTFSMYQLRMFYSATHFKDLGVIYRDTKAGRADAGLKTIYSLSVEYGFDVHTYILAPTEDSQTEVLNGIKYLVPKVDALFVPELPGITYKNIKSLRLPILTNQIPSFAQQGEDMVHKGLLMSYAPRDYSAVGEFYASVVGRILNEVLPNNIPQIYSPEMGLYLNRKTAEIIEFDIPSVAAITAETIFTRIADKHETNFNKKEQVPE